MLIKDVMTKEVISAELDTPIEEVSKMLIENRIHGVPVVENGRPVGMITETDFFTKGSVTIYLPEYINLLKQKIPLDSLSDEKKEEVARLMDTKAKDVMSSPCATIDQDSEVAEFFGLVKGRGFSSVPVVDSSGNLCGIVTLADIINLMHIA